MVCQPKLIVIHLIIQENIIVYMAIVYKEKRLGDGQQGHIMARCKFIGPYIDHRKAIERKNQSPEWVRENHG